MKGADVQNFDWGEPLSHLHTTLLCPIQHTANMRQVRLHSTSKETREHLPVSGDLKSGIPADVLTPVQPITRYRGASKKNTGQLISLEGEPRSKGVRERTGSQLSDAAMPMWHVVEISMKASPNLKHRRCLLGILNVP